MSEKVIHSFSYLQANYSARLLIPKMVMLQHYTMNLSTFIVVAYHILSSGKIASVLENPFLGLKKNDFTWNEIERAGHVINQAFENEKVDLDLLFDEFMTAK